MKKIKDTLAHIVYKILIFLVKILPAQSGNKHLLVIKLDEIGDYILFRNSLKYLKQSSRYKDYKITLIGNSAWEQIFNEYDSNSVDNVIWVHKKKLNRNLLYRFSVLKTIRHQKTSDVINFVFSRSFILDDGFAYVATGADKIAMISDNVNRGEDANNMDKHIYSSIINAGDGKTFESFHNSIFLNSILNRNDIPFDSFIQTAKEYPKIADKYFVLFLGAGNPERKWPIEYFIKTAEYTTAKYKLKAVICGGPPDTADADKFMKILGERGLNFTAKTTLPEYVEIVRNAVFTISVDTGPLHIALATKCPVIGLFSGKFFGRYAPYPKEMNVMLYPIYPDFVDQYIKENNEILYNPFIMKNDTIKLIDTSKILPVIDKITYEIS